MSTCKFTDSLEGLASGAANTNVAVATDAQMAVRESVCEVVVHTAITTTTALSERTVYRAKRKCRVVGLYWVAAANVTGTVTDYFTVLIDKRPASAYGTPANMATHAADTATDDDLVAFTPKNIGFGSSYGSATSTVFDLAIGDTITAEITKANSGMTCPVSSLVIITEPRD